MRVFISYSHHNLGFAERLAIDLERAGIPVWRDKESIRLGAKWDPALLDAVLECEGFLLVASPEAAQSTYVAEEVKCALSAGRNLTMIRAGGAIDALPEHWRKLQMAEGSYWEAVQKVIAHFNGKRIKTAMDVLLRSGITYREAREELDWREAAERQPGSEGDLAGLVAVPLLVNARGCAYLAGPADEPVAAAPETPIAVVFRFSGEPGESSPDEVARYLRASRVPRLLCVEGPKTGNRFTIPIDSDRVWRELAELSVTAVNLWPKRLNYPIEVFLHAPNALAFALGTRLRGLTGFTVYHFTRTSPRYMAVYSRTGAE